MMKMLSVASECAPLVKTGGLADVVGALPQAVAPLGCDMRTLLPGYRMVKAKLGKTKTVSQFDDLFGGKATLLACEVAGLDLLVLDAPHLYERDGGIYIDPTGEDWPDNPQRFAALSFVAAAVAAGAIADWQPDIVHGHDWQAGFTPEYLHATGCAVPFVFTIHNIAFHGTCGREMLDDLRLDPDRFDVDHFEFWGQISALKAGLCGAAKINTVSETYAGELLTPAFGMGMDGVLMARRGDLSGIVNGVDENAWNPQTDPHITPYERPTGKKPNKQAVRKVFGLGPSRGPLFVLVSRLSEQKGIDLLIEALPDLLAHGGQLALLGSGDPRLEVALLEAAAEHKNVAVKIGYDEALSHLMIAGGDAILVPSRFEPCGLTQLYGLRYGTLPVVALTGGLADTVINASPAALNAGVATGVQFFPIDAQALANGLARLHELYRQPRLWRAMQRNAMKQDVGWANSAKAYYDIYSSLM